MKAPLLTTDRLRLVPLVKDDAPQIQAVFPQWEIVRHLAASFPWPFPDDGASRYVNTIALPAAEKGSGWFWTIRRQAAPEQLIGLITLSDQADNNRGFWLDPAWQHQGLMTEACRCVTDFWFNTLHREVLRAPKARDNDGSRKISMNSGMRLIRVEKQQFTAGMLDAELWEITREEWNRLVR
ncbi:GNAT family N-acetyltransferase [Raoultella ornithinolytica]|uniref:GNAT family N-acetyltransferase n=1 Tax=Raoultella ornithinolytica TaxID=54291 RepID=UPI002959B798|nr:GNAT family N-acetyltransferase [Raoultella ornithinolytica]ELT0730068.1 GNAT family N-acetyltransferase [Raoultella ornithinolytica]